MKQHIKSLITQVKVLNDKYDAIKKISGENFNIFSILNLERDEVKTHSYFIYDLINPSGSHNQGNTFLKLFLKEILTSDEYKSIDSAEHIKVMREDPTNENRRIDFTIETSELLIAIEMKINADDQPKQLLDYDKYIKEKKDQTKLYYLTLLGTDASEKSKGTLKKDIDYHPISFSYHIYCWIEDCIEKSATIPTLREGLVHYRNLIRKLTNQTSEGIGKEMEKILKTPKDIEAANTIVQEYAKVWAKKEVEFWSKLKEKINTDWKIEYCTDKKDTSESIDYELIAHNRSKKDDYFGLFFRKNVELYTFTCNVYAYNSDNHLIIDFCIQRDEEDIELPELVQDILGSIGFNEKTDDGLHWVFLQKTIQFYGRYVSEPTFELFNDVNFKDLVNNTAKEVTEQLKKISEKEDEILKDIQNES